MVVKIDSSLYGDKEEMIFGGILSFARQTYSRNLNNIDIAIIGIPFDLATSYRPGTRFGPAAIRQSSAQLAWGPLWPWGFNPIEKLRIIDYGDWHFDYATPTSILKIFEKQAADLIGREVSTIILGGDHLITLPILRAYSKKYGKISVVHFDAHPDTWESPVMRLDHGTFMYHALKENLIDPRASVQVGIRTYNEKQYNLNVIDMDWINQQGTVLAAQKIKDIIGDNLAYLTFDIDCLDPAYAPGTGAPVVGGLTTFQVLDIIRKLGEINFIGMDIVEVCPAYDHLGITSLAAATIVLEYLALYANRKLRITK